MNYYLVKVRFDKPRWRAGWHVIKATSKEDALRIREKYGISCPMNATDFISITCEKIDMRLLGGKVLIDRRRRGIGGSIWCEKDGKLCTESIKEWKEQK